MRSENFNKLKTTKEARALLSQGKSRQEVFDTLVEKYKQPKKTADILQYIPDKQAVKKYGFYNYTLAALFLLTAVFLLWHGFYISPVLAFGLIIFVVLKMLIKYYVWISAFSATLLISVVVVLFAHSFDSESIVAAIGIAVLAIPEIVLPLWLERKISNKPEVKKEKYTDSNGKEKYRVKYIFKENNE